MGKVIVIVLVSQVCGLLAVAWALTDSGLRLFGTEQVPAALALYLGVGWITGRATAWAYARKAQRRQDESAT